MNTKMPSCPEEIWKHLSEKEIAEIDFRLLGQQVREAAVDLSVRTNQELLEPISAWLNDQDFMKRHAVVLEDGPSWAEYKRQQRDAERRINRDQQAEALRRYWAAVKHKKQLLQEVARIIPKRSPSDTTSHTGSDTTTPDRDGLAAVFGPFSHSAEHARQLSQEFQAVREMSVSETLPWRTVLRSELHTQRLFRDLPTLHEDPRKDRVARFCHLLHMDHAGEVELEQDETGEITIRPRQHHEHNTLTIKDRQGNELRLDWDALSDAQREKVIADAGKNRIICKTEG